MLVLSRKPGQAILIGDVRITVVKTNSRAVIGIDAPQEMRIVRAELDENESELDEYESLQRETPNAPAA